MRNFLLPSTVRDIRSFLGHAGFYRRYIKDFSLISKPLCSLLMLNTEFIWTKDCENSFNKLKTALISSPILAVPDWNLPFEIMCDASDFAVGAVLGQKNEKSSVVLYYASKTLNDAQKNYTTTEKEMLAVVFALEKFRSYILGSHIVIYTDHSALKFLLTKIDTKPRLIRWIFLLQEFDLEIKDKKGVENSVADHLSRLTTGNESADIPLEDSFPDERLFAVSEAPWYAVYCKLLSDRYDPIALVTSRFKMFLC